MSIGVANAPAGRIRRSPARLLAALSVVLAACSTPPQQEARAPTGAPAGIRAAEPLELLRVATVRDKVHVVVDRDGLAHVLIASTELRQVHEVTVGPGGDVARRLVRADAAPWRVDGAFDAKGRFHVLIDSEHMVLEEGRWSRSDRTPWQAGGVKAQAARFARGTPDLVWSFEVSGADVGAPRRVDIYGFGGAGAGIAWPWVTRGTRTAVVAQLGEGYGPWLVADPGDKEDTQAVQVVGDREGNVHLVYECDRGGLASEALRRHVKLGAPLLQGGTAAAAAGALQANSARPVVPVHGRAVSRTVLVRASAPAGANLVTSPVPGFSATRVCEGGGAMHSVSFGPARDRWGGKGLPVRYARLEGKEWTAPLELGLADVSSFWGAAWDALALACTDGGKAFAVWPTEQAIVGRWIEPLP